LSRAPAAGLGIVRRPCPPLGAEAPGRDAAGFALARVDAGFAAFLVRVPGVVRGRALPGSFGLSPAGLRDRGERRGMTRILQVKKRCGTGRSGL